MIREEQVLRLFGEANPIPDEELLLALFLLSVPSCYPSLKGARQ